NYKKVIHLQDRDAHAYGCMAWILTTADPKYRDPVQALQMAKKAVELAPREASYRTALGIAHIRAGEGQAALRALKKAMKLSEGGDGSDWFFVAMAHWQLGNKPEARRWYDRAVAWLENYKEAIARNKRQLDLFHRIAAETAKLLEVKQD